MKSPASDWRPDPARLEELFHAAVERPTSERSEFLAQACAGDLELRQALDGLLAAHGRSSTLWRRSAFHLEARGSSFDLCAPRLGAYFGPYRIVRRIASGGMSVVYEAVRDDGEYEKRVAIKLVPGADDPAGAERFRSERQILAELDHPNIASLLDGGTTSDGLPFLVMEYVDGTPIDRYVQQHGLDTEEKLRIFLEVCGAVDYAHRHLVIHRDLKPANILVMAGGVPKLLDFGIAKLLSDGTRAASVTVPALTPEYASPEQVLGRKVNISTDVYSLGVMLFVMLAGRLPYPPGENETAELVQAICEREPEWDQSIRGDLRSILNKALRKQPEHRYLSVEQFASDLRRFCQGLPVTARPDTFLYRAQRFVARRSVPLAAACLILIAVAAGIFATVAQSRRAERRFLEVRALAHSFLFDVYDALGTRPGTLPARRLVASRAQQYLDELASDTSNDPDLTRELAESYLRLGVVRGAPYTPNLGDTPGALADYRKAQTLLESLASRFPNDPAIERQLSETYRQLSRVLSRRHEWAAALQSMRRALPIAESLARRFPDNAPDHANLLRTYAYLGEVQENIAFENKSLSGLQQALATSKRSENPFRVAYALWDLADLTGDKAYYREALDHQLAGLAKARRLAVEQPETNNRELADALLSIALSRVKCCNDVAGALRDDNEALSAFQKISNAEPQNIEARIDLANGYEGLAAILTLADRPSDALQAHIQALDIYTEVGRADPTNSEIAYFAKRTQSQVRAIQESQSKKSP